MDAGTEALHEIGSCFFGDFSALPSSPTHWEVSVATAVSLHRCSSVCTELSGFLMWPPGGFYLKSPEAFLLLQSKCDDWYYRSENSTFEYILSIKEAGAFSKARINK